MADKQTSSHKDKQMQTDIKAKKAAYRFWQIGRQADMQTKICRQI
jgi:hypothetical protein